MANVKIQGNASGSGVLTITAPDTDATRTITLPDSTGSIQTVDGESYSPRGLICSNDTDTDHDVAISVGGVKDATNTANMTLAAILTKRIDAAWAVGDNNGGLDGTESSGGTPDASTLYYVWLIKRSDTGVVDALYSESPTGPTMPTNYDYKRLIGSVLTDGSANIIAFLQSGDYFRYMGDVIQDLNDNTITDDTFETATLSVPPSSIAHVYFEVINTTTSRSEMVGYLKTKGAADTATDAEAVAFFQTDTAADSEATTVLVQVLVDSSKQVEYTCNETDGTATVRIRPLGFTMLTRSNP